VAAGRRRLPVRFVLDAHGVRDPIDVVEVGDDLDGVVDGRVSPAELAQALHVVRLDGGRGVRDLHREVAERADARLEIGLPIVVRGVVCELVRGALGTEVVCVGADSVVAVVGARNHDREQLALDAREFRRAEHDRPIEAHRSRKHLWVQRHRLHDVEDLSRARDCRLVLRLQLARSLVFLDQTEVGHAAILT